MSDAQTYISDSGDTVHPAGDESLLRNAIAPLDSYTESGVYWADLPTSERRAWVWAQNRAEGARERALVWDMFKKDPLAPLGAYWRLYCMTGLGIFVEGFTLFSIGNVQSLFSAAFPTCWKTFKDCDVQWTYAVSYLEIIGIICGQILVGIEGDWIGRRFGLVQDAVVMTIGTMMLIAAWGVTLEGWVICYAWSLWFYGVGVGGEYPMTSTRAMEKNRGKSGSRADKLHRGRDVQLAFLMQGWGQLFNQGVLIVLLFIFNHHGGAPYSKPVAQWTYRLSFAAILPFTAYLAYYRFYKLQYADAALVRSRKRLHTSGYDMVSLKLAFGHYWPRLLATAGAWFCNDFFFYGNKIFQSQFITIIAPGSSVMTGWLYNLINIGVSLVGYYAAAYWIDNKFYGRKRMQTMGFVFDFICFVIPAFAYGPLTKKGAGIKVFQFLYFFSSFWNQFGPNATTFLVAAESYPTSIRSSAHGFSAAWGKLGALAPAILYNYISSPVRFKVVPWFGIAGVILTEIFLPDTTGLDLREQERYWTYVSEGREHEYHGIAVHPRHLSLWERWVQKRHLHYDAAKDRVAKIAELRATWTAMQKESIDEKTGAYDGVDADEASFVDDDVHSYFSSQPSFERHPQPELHK
ncbi:MFS general substrate transporter [Clavulina sp. PMI_390]|nr:MFS general substrate transporter [Clavulina sp. PMI_390]